MYLWIQFILLKTKNWKHYSKIIFKCVNSVVRPIFNIFFSDEQSQTVMNSAQIVHCVLKAVACESKIK